ncbi:MAG: D-glycerate dehydrogenase [Nevskia sp.]|nr:D-glycerate dehydrogenase [Nevskia sp.]
MARPRLLVTRRVTEDVAARASEEFDAVLPDHDLDADETLATIAAQRSDAVFMGPRARLTAAHIAALPASVRILANPSAGFDHMDVAAAKARGIVVTNTPDVLTDCTADMAFLLILAACRRAGEYNAIMQAGWGTPYGFPDLLGIRASNRTLGIVGLGRIGRAVARRAAGFGMRVLYTDRTRLPAELEAGAEFVPDLAALLPRCEILSLHAPGGGQGPLMTAETFALLPRGAVFVNAARGSLVDEDALIAALRSGQLFAAGLDVYRNEPQVDRRLTELPNVFLTPHVASATRETRKAMGFRALDNIAAVLGGKPALDPV